MKLSCCSKSGVYCSTYNRSDLYGRVWELSHGVNCTDEQFRIVRISLLAQEPKVDAPVAATSVAKNFDCDCVGAGFCTYFKTSLNKRAWELSHGMNCTEEQQTKVVSMIENKLKSLPIAREKLVVVATDQTITLKPKGCGCGK